MIRLLRSGVFVLLCVSPMLAQEQSKAGFTEALSAVRAPLHLAGGKFSGAGAAILGSAIEQARFVLLGEEHFTREIPAFAAAVCDVMHPDAYAIEAGPAAAGFVGGLARSPDREAKTAARFKAYPGSLAFLDFRGENDLTAHCAASSRNPRFALWGLDQEFLGSAGALLDAMAATHPGPSSGAAIAAAQTREHLCAGQAYQSGDYAKLFLLASTDAEIERLATAVNLDGNADTRKLFKEFTASRAIYHLNSAGSPDANRVRGILLKQHFLEDYAALKKQTPAPRVLFKFGDNHTAKGLNTLHQRDLGNFVAELADAEQAQSLHILFLAPRGTLPGYGGYRKPLKYESYTLADLPEYAWLLPAVQDLLPASPGSSGIAATLFDLRKLRFRPLDMPSEWQRIVYSNDLLIVLPEFTPGTLIEPLP